MSQDTGEEGILVKIVDQDNTEMVFKVKKSISMSQLMDEYSKRKYKTKGGVKLRFCYKGRTLHGEESVKDAELEDNSVIEVFSSQVGG